MLVSNEVSAFLFLFFVLFNWYWVQRRIDLVTTPATYRLYPSCIIAEDEIPQKKRKTNHDTNDAVENVVHDEIPTLGKRQILNPAPTQSKCTQSKPGAQARDSEYQDDNLHQFGHSNNRKPSLYQRIPNPVHDSATSGTGYGYGQPLEFPRLPAGKVTPSMVVYQISQGHVANVYHWPLPKVDATDPIPSAKMSKKKEKKAKKEPKPKDVEPKGDAPAPQHRLSNRLPFDELEVDVNRHSTIDLKTSDKIAAKPSTSFLSADNSPSAFHRHPSPTLGEASPDVFIPTFKSALSTAVPQNGFVSPIKIPKHTSNPSETPKSLPSTPKTPNNPQNQAGGVKPKASASGSMQETTPTGTPPKETSASDQTTVGKSVTLSITNAGCSLVKNPLSGEAVLETTTPSPTPVPMKSSLTHQRELAIDLFGESSPITPGLERNQDRTRPDSPPTPRHRPRKTVSFVNGKSHANETRVSDVHDSTIGSARNMEKTPIVQNSAANLTEKIAGQVESISKFQSFLGFEGSIGVPDAKSIQDPILSESAPLPQKPAPTQSTEHFRMLEKPEIPNNRPIGSMTSTNTTSAAEILPHSQYGSGKVNSIDPVPSQTRAEMLEEQIGSPLKIKLSEGMLNTGREPTHVAPLVTFATNQTPPLGQPQKGSSFFGSSLSNTSIFTPQPPGANSIFAKKPGEGASLFSTPATVSAAAPGDKSVASTPAALPRLGSAAQTMQHVERESSRSKPQPDAALSKSFTDRLDSLNLSMSTKRIKRN